MASSSSNMGLTLWDSLTDYFNNAELADNFTDIDAHDHTSGKGVQIPEGGLAPDSVTNSNLKDNSITGNKMLNRSITAIKLATDSVKNQQIADDSVTQGALFDNSVGVEQLDTPVNNALGITESSTVRRGNFTRTAQDDRTNTAYGKMANADEVSNVVVSSTGLLHIMYRAEWKKSTTGATATAAIFLDTNQLKYTPLTTATAPAVQEVDNDETDVVWHPLYTDEDGVAQSTNSSDYSGDANTTGQIVKYTTVEVDAGTYDVSVQFKITTGTVSVRNRSLYVWTAQYA